MKKLIYFLIFAVFGFSQEALSQTELRAINNARKALNKMTSRKPQECLNGALAQMIGLSKAFDPSCLSEDQKKLLLFTAAAEGKADAVKYYLDQGVDPNIRDADRRTPLLYGAEEGNAKVAEILLKRGADPNIQDNFSESPLRISALFNRTGYAELLLAGGANPNIRDEDGRTPLHIAAAPADELTGHLNLSISAMRPVPPKGIHFDWSFKVSVFLNRAGYAELLLAGGANPNIQDKDGRTPLHDAARGGRERIAEALLAAGAEIMPDSEGKSPLDLCMERPHLASICENKLKPILARHAP